MAQHAVIFSTPKVAVGNADFKFKIRKNRAVLGTLRVSKGALVWMPRDKKKRGRRFGWSRFADLMKNG